MEVDYYLSRPVRLGRVIIEVILMGEQKHVSHLKIFFEIEEDN